VGLLDDAIGRQEQKDADDKARRDYSALYGVGWVELLDVQSRFGPWTKGDIRRTLLLIREMCDRIPPSAGRFARAITVGATTTYHLPPAKGVVSYDAGPFTSIGERIRIGRHHRRRYAAFEQGTPARLLLLSRHYGETSEDYAFVQRADGRWAPAVSELRREWAWVDHVDEVFADYIRSGKGEREYSLY
jgi:hypothetical protein